MDALDSLTPQQKDVLEQFQVCYSNLSNSASEAPLSVL